MAFLATETTVVTLTDGLARLADAGAPREPMVAVTFDDGTADFAEVALPVLVEHRVPVTLYVATDFVERGIAFPDDGAPLTVAGAARRGEHRAGRRRVAHPRPRAARPAARSDRSTASSTGRSTSSASAWASAPGTSPTRRR